MGLVFLFGLILLLLIFIFLILTGSIEYKIEKLTFSNINKEKKMKIEFLSYLEFYLFSKIRVFRLKIDKDKLKKAALKDKLKKVNFEKLKIDKPLRKENIEAMKKIQIKLREFRLELEIGTENVLISSFLVTFFSTIISLFLTKTIKEFNEEDYSFRIKPIYIGENIVKMKFNCILSIKVVHIIYIIYTYLKEKGEWKKNERTSNRRSYGYSYE